MSDLKTIVPFDSEEVALDLRKRSVEVTDFSTQAGSNGVVRKVDLGENFRLCYDGLLQARYIQADIHLVFQDVLK